MLFNNFNNRTKIVATLGPATADVDTLVAMVQAGVNCFRLNFSHSDHATHLQNIQNILAVREQLKTPVAMLADLQGPKIRVGVIQGEALEVNTGDTLIFTSTPCEGTKDGIYISYKNFPKDVQKGERILLDDGKLVFEVLDTNREDKVTLKVVIGGLLKSKKGVNLPNTKVSLPCITEKDLKDLEFALAHNVEWIGLSFVRNPNDIRLLKSLIAEKGSSAQIVAKIEKPEALEHLEEIIAETDAVMVARGDLGVEVPLPQLPILQKRIVKKCLEMAKPVIIATQMMESMIENASPTRAEVNDVANSVMDGADAVMLSAETSVGKYPVLVIENMSRIIYEVETQNYDYHKRATITEEESKERFVSDIILYASSLLVRGSNAKAVVGLTQTGYAAKKIASFRPNANIYIFTSNHKIINTLSLIWGVRCFYYDMEQSTDETITELTSILKAKEIVTTGDILVHIASIPVIERGKTNMLKLNVVN